MEPTLYGHALLKRAKEILWGVEDLERELQLLKGLGAGEFKVIMGLFPAELSGYKAVGRIISNHPELLAKVFIMTSSNYIDLLRDRSVDIAFGEISVIEDKENFDIEEVGVHRVIFFCRPVSTELA